MVLMVSVPAAIFFNASAEPMAHFGFPAYFAVELNIAKILGGIVLLLPMFSKRLKEWAYVGFAIDFISAGFAIGYVDGLKNEVMVLVAMVLLTLSYLSFHKLNK